MRMGSGLVSDTMSLSSPPVSYVEERVVLPASPNPPVVEERVVLPASPESMRQRYLQNLDPGYLERIERERVRYEKDMKEYNRKLEMFKTGMKTPVKTPVKTQPMTPGTPPTPVMNVDENTIVEETRTINSYQLMGQLGSGGQGTVFKAKVKSTGKIIALKVIKITGTYREREAIKRQTQIEINNLVEISNPCQKNLSCYYASHFDMPRNEILIEMEYVEGMQLDKWARQKRSDPRFYAYLMAIMIKLSEAIKYINAKNIIHRDIKPQNILIREDEPVLIDFGLACQSKICRSGLPNLPFICCYGRDGTPVFMAPETVKDNQSYFVTDIWGLGATIYYVATGSYHYPFVNVNDTQSVLQMIAYQQPYSLNTSSGKLNKVVNACLNKDALTRITADKLLSTLLSKTNLF